MTTYSFREKNIRNTWVIFGAFFAVIIGIGWAVSYIYNDQSLLLIAVLFSIGMNVLAYWKSDSIAMQMSGAHEVTRESARELYNLVENLTIASGLPMPRLYVIEDHAANAFATGRNPQHAAIAVTTGLLERMDRSELEGVLAHELSHIKNYDTLIMTVAVVLVGFLALISDFFVRSMWFGRHSDDDRRDTNPVMLAIGVAAIILAPIAGTLMQLAISRKREFVADSSAALMTRYPEGLAAALEKLSLDSPLAHPKQATAHLFIVNPFKADSAERKTRAQFFSRLFMTHPPIEDRIAALRKLNTGE